MKRNIFALALAFAVLISAAQAATLFDGIASPWCPAKGVTSFTAQNVATTAEYDYSSNILTDLLESTFLFVKAGTTTTNYAFKSFDNTGTVVGQHECSNSKKLAFHALVNDYLFLTNNGGKYFVCRFALTADSSLIQLETSGIFSTGTLTDWDPLSVQGNNIYVLAGSSSSSKVVTYTFSDSSPTISPATTSAPTPKPLASPVGSDVFLYDTNRTQFLAYNSGSWDVDTIITSSAIGTNTVNVYNLQNSNLIVTLTESASFNGDVYTVAGTTAVKQSATTSSSITIQDYTDNLYNFIRIDSTNFLWITLRTSSGFLVSTIDVVEELPISGTLTNIFNVGISQNKASVLYNDLSLDILRHDDNGAVKLLFSKTVSGTIDTTTSSNNEYRISLACICEAIKRFVCFSHTLNCVIVNKAGANCINGGDDYTTW